ncbi:MAG: hypothetical protein HOG49_21650 [Candidatus Scalindua sp.]|jgi:hypothetical protein|nr:hypothetical protein [Candidatus Scalindua sp.]
MRTLKLTNSQSKFITDKESKAIAFVTGYGGGKSFILFLKMVQLKLKYPKYDLCYLFPIFSMFRDILYPNFEEILDELNIGYRINKSTNEIFFDVGGRIILKSMDDPDHIVGFNVLAVFLDELDTLATDKATEVWMKAIARARKWVHKVDDNGFLLYETVIEGKIVQFNEKVLPENPNIIMQYDWDELIKEFPDLPPEQFDGKILEVSELNQLFVGTTPEGYRFVYKMFEKEKPDNYRLIQASGRENVFLPKDYYDDMQKVYPAEYVNAYIEGQFVNMALGTVYKNFHRKDDKFDSSRKSCDSKETYRRGETLHIGIDFNVHNMNAIVYVDREPLQATEENKGYPYVGQPTLHAIHHFDGLKDTPELIQAIRKRYPISPIFTYPDASGKNASSKGVTVSDISMLRDALMRPKYPSKNPRIMDRVLSTNSAFKAGLLWVNVKKCPKLADSLEQQVFSEATELPEKLKGSSIDDINDSATYIIHFRYPISRKAMKSKKLKGGRRNG